MSSTIPERTTVVDVLLDPRVTALEGRLVILLEEHRRLRELVEYLAGRVATLEGR